MKKIFLIVALMSFGVTVVNAQFAATPNDVKPLMVGQAVPDIVLTNGNDSAASLHGMIGERPTVIMFYRGDWCSNCISHFKTEIAPNLARMGDLGYNVVLISPDDPAHIRITAEKTGVPPSMIWSDSAGELSVAMGIAWQQQERLLERLAEHSGGKNKGFVPVISTFVVDADKKIVFEDIRPSAIAADARIKGKLLMAVLENL